MAKKSNIKNIADLLDIDYAHRMSLHKVPLGVDIEIKKNKEIHAEEVERLIKYFSVWVM